MDGVVVDGRQHIKSGLFKSERQTANACKEINGSWARRHACTQDCLQTSHSLISIVSLTGGRPESA
jgi:hypothetical protein